MSKKIIECTDKQYEVIRYIVRNLCFNLETRESYTKRAHKSRKDERFSISVPWKQVKLLQHLKEKLK